MQDVIPLKKRIKILIKLTFDKQNLLFIPSKVSSILSQQNVYESNLVDDFIIKFFSKFLFKKFFKKNYNSLKIPIIINIYKKKIKTDIIILNPTTNFIFKRLLDSRRFLNPNLFTRKTLYSIELIKINIIKFLFFNPDFSLNIFKKYFIYMNGLFYSMEKRQFMKNRKINFRRKVKRDSEGNIIN